MRFCQTIFLFLLVLMPAEPLWAQKAGNGVRHEKWVFAYAVSQRAAAPAAKMEALADISMAEELQTLRSNRGLDIFFYQDGTFKIRDWFYGESSGLLQTFTSGTYRIKDEIPEIELVFNAENKPDAAYFMHPLISRDSRSNATLVKARIAILEQTDDGWLKAEITGTDARNRTYPIGQAMFTCESLSKPSVWRAVLQRIWR